MDDYLECLHRRKEVCQGPFFMNHNELTKLSVLSSGSSLYISTNAFDLNPTLLTMLLMTNKYPVLDPLIDVLLYPRLLVVCCTIGTIRLLAQKK